MVPGNNPSPIAARELIEAVESGEITPFSYETDDYMGATDCPDGCAVEVDGYCPHGYISAGRTAGLV
jgi:hypothetical protein